MKLTYLYSIKESNELQHDLVSNNSNSNRNRIPIQFGFSSIQRGQMKITHFILLLFGTLIISCSQYTPEGSYLTSDALPVSSYLTKNADKFSIWIDLLNYTDLYNAMNLSSSYTCFIPTNDAMNSFLKSKNLTSVTGLDKTYATKLVKCHTIVGDELTQSEFVQGILPDTTASGDFLSVGFKNGGLSAIYVNGCHINTADISVSNGVIHSLDSVIIPITETIADKLTNNSNYSIFKAALTATGYYNTFVADASVSSSQLSKYTMFVVPNDVYQAASINSVSDLANSLGAGSDYTSSTNALNKYVGYHVLNQMMSYSSLSDTTVLNKNLSTLTSGELIHVSQVSNTLYLNYNSTSKTGVQLVNTNLNCKNGVIHTINSTMPIVTPPLSTVYWDLTAYSDIQKLFPSVYQLSTLSSASTNTVTQGSVSCYTWQTVPYDKTDGVKYYVAVKGTTGISSALNHDYLYMNLGLYGWIQMTSATILKGTYSVSLSFYTPSSLAAAGGFLSIYLDNTFIGTVTTRTKGLSAAAYTTSAVGSSKITFSNTTSHTLRILQNDDIGSSNYLYIDKITLTPQ